MPHVIESTAEMPHFIQSCPWKGQKVPLILLRAGKVSKYSMHPCRQIMFSSSCRYQMVSYSCFTSPEPEMTQNSCPIRQRSSKSYEILLSKPLKDGSHFVTPLIIAAHNGHLNSVKILLRYEADIEAQGTLKIAEDKVMEGCTPLWAAASAGRLDVVKLLIERNADIEGKTSTGSTPLRTAAYRGHLDIVRCLVESGADVNARSSCDNSTILMMACFRGHLSVVTYLINKGAFMDLQGKDDRTALHHAVQGGHLKIVSELLALGASQLPNNLGLTPLLYACDECLVEMVEHIIGRPECTKEQRIDALELLGATIANDSFGVSEKAFSYMKRGMEMRYEDPEHPLLKKKMQPVEAYPKQKRESNS